MVGVIIETLSWRNLGLFGLSLLAVLIGTFLIGGLIAPQPSFPMMAIATKCIDEAGDSPWLWPRGSGACKHVDDLDNLPRSGKGYNPNHIVFAFQMPLPRSNVDLDMSRWFQSLLAVIQPEIHYDPHLEMGERPTLTMDVRLGARDRGEAASQWHLIGASREQRTLDCHIDEKKEDDLYRCSILHLFELGSCHYDFYLVNIRVPTDAKFNLAIGKLRDFQAVFIAQTGGFTQVWFSLKTVMFPVVLVTLIWFSLKLRRTKRQPVLLERMLLALGIAMSMLNLPVEWLSLLINMPFMLLLTDIRQGIFYCCLLCFWMVFTGEHQMDIDRRDNLKAYWRHLTVIVVGCLCLFLFDMCERGVQLTNPFYSIWNTDEGSKIAFGFIVTAGICACLYFLFLCYMVACVLKNICGKRAQLPQMNRARKLFYEGLIFRFQFLLIATVVCAGLTVSFYIMSQLNENQQALDDDDNVQTIPIEVASAFYTGVYGMWNIYVFALLILYAPSFKDEHVVPCDGVSGSSNDRDGEMIELTASRMIGETSVLAHFAKKAAAE